MLYGQYTKMNDEQIYSKPILQPYTYTLVIVNWLYFTAGSVTWNKYDTLYIYDPYVWSWTGRFVSF